MDHILRIVLSLLPVIVFLAALVYLDSYKLVRFRAIVLTLAVGAVSALGALILNSLAMDFLLPERAYYSRYGAPVIEELLKIIFIVVLLRRKKVGFMVDAGIRGFAVGAGFALFENIYYLQSLQTMNLFVWVIRGFGTAVMHGGTTCIAAIVIKNFMDVKNSENIFWCGPGFAAAVAIHSFFNHLIFPPIINTAIILAALPALMLTVYQRSEQSTNQWLGTGFDADSRILHMIKSGTFAETSIGRYLCSVRERFAPEIVLDLFCTLRIFLELTVQAKGILLMRESGFDIPADPEIQNKLKELNYLETSIGKTGRLALAPFMRTSSRDLWQLQLLQK